MKLRIAGFLAFVNSLEFWILENTTFSKLDVSILICAHMRMETDPVSETLFFLAFRIPDDGQSPTTQ
jgi:hypothetical protein